MAKFNCIGGGWWTTTPKGERYVRVSFRASVEPGHVVVMWENKRKRPDKKDPHFQFFMPEK